MNTNRAHQSAAHSLGEFIDASPTPYHAVANAVAQLETAGFSEFDGRDATSPGKRFFHAGGVLIAWADGTEPRAAGSYIAAHTDSPNLRLRPRPDLVSAGVAQLRIEVYGGALLNSWLDRDLGLAGRVALRGRGSVSTRLWRSEQALLRVPQLAIHLDREVNERGLLLDRQRHLTPMWALAGSGEESFAGWLAGQLEVSSDDILGWDLSCFDWQPHALLGANEEFLCAARLDNLASCHAGLQALLAVCDSTTAPTFLLLFDNEEVGSTTASGADSTLAARVLERRAAALGMSRSEWLASLEGSVLLSADMAHATHPNYPERHEPGHQIALGGGPAVKYNVNARYASEAPTAALFKSVCDAAGVPHQAYSHRGDLPCGSTIGPLLAAQLALPTVDVGAPQLSMHSARELMAVADVAHLEAAFTAWFRSPAR